MTRKRSTTSKARFGANVKARRIEAGLTQHELALELGLTDMQVYWLEREGRGMERTIDAAAKVLRCQPAELLV